jgi:iron complex transport system substrate-binding protein
MIFTKIATAAAIAVAAILPTAVKAGAETITVTDIAGRQVEVNTPVERVILGEGRQIYLVAALDTADPFRRVVGWREDFSQADPDNYAVYLEKFPQMARIPTFGGFKDGTFDVEQAISLKPDVMIMNIESKAATEDAQYIEKSSPRSASR